MANSIDLEALHVGFHDGCVMIFGPGDIALVLTPAMARESARSLISAAAAADQGRSGVVPPQGLTLLPLQVSDVVHCANDQEPAPRRPSPGRRKPKIKGCDLPKAPDGLPKP
jgi:hypothetical protein